MAKSATPAAALRALRSIQAEFGPGLAARKVELVRALARARLQRARDVLALHESLLFLWAYADDAVVLDAVEGALAAFGARRDVREFRAELEDSGVAGTDIVYRFYAEMAKWLAASWPDALTIDWDNVAADDDARLGRLLPFCVLPAEAACMEELVFSTRDWIERLKGPDETDAAFVIRRCERLPLSNALHEHLYQELGLWLRLAPRPGSPARTTSCLPAALRGPRTYQAGPLQRKRPDLAAEAQRPPRAVRELTRAEGAAVIDLARVAMVTRSRDLDAFSYGNPDDVRLVEHEDGLAFAAIGVLPERRLLFESVYAFLTLKNGVPIGYVLNSALYGSAEIAYNVFETFRGGEAAHVYGRVVSTLVALFGVDSFTVYPYQLGDENEEALASGAWWFYQKLGFRPKAKGALRLMRQELAAQRRDPAHRSPRAVLAELARENVYLHLGDERDDVIGVTPYGDAGLAVADYVAARFGRDREGAEATCCREAAALCGGVDTESWTASERAAWRRYAPLLVALPGVQRWSPAERRALADIARAKGGQRESDFVRKFDQHRRLRAAVLELTRRV